MFSKIESHRIHIKNSTEKLLEDYSILLLKKNNLNVKDKLQFKETILNEYALIINSLKWHLLLTLFNTESSSIKSHLQKALPKNQSMTFLSVSAVDRFKLWEATINIEFDLKEKLLNMFTTSAVIISISFISLLMINLYTLPILLVVEFSVLILSIYLLYTGYKTLYNTLMDHHSMEHLKRVKPKVFYNYILPIIKQATSR